MKIKNILLKVATCTAISYAVILPHYIFAADDGSGLKYSVAADIVGKFGAKHVDNASSDRDRVLAREAEFLFYGPIDHIFDGAVSGAAHFEDGESVFELHEAYVNTSKLIPRSRIRLGKFFLGVGRLNRVHRHDWYFTTAPKVQNDFFASEAADDTGLEYSYLLPLPFYLDLSAGVTSGFTFGHSHDAGTRPLTPTHYARLATFTELSNSTGAEFALNYLGRTTNTKIKTDLYGFDFLTKWREGKTVRFLVMSEIWLQHQENATGLIEKRLGTYLYPQYGFSPEWYFGTRFDTFSFLNKSNAITKQRENNVTYTVVPTITFKPSEFSTFRLSYTNTVYRELSETRNTDHLIELQTTFILGAHPAHDF